MGSRNWKSHDHRDANEPSIIEALKKLGWVVHRLRDVCDLVAICPRCLEVQLIEVKNPDTHARSRGGDKRTELQRRLHAAFQVRIITLVIPPTELPCRCVRRPDAA